MNPEGIYQDLQRAIRAVLEESDAISVLESLEVECIELAEKARIEHDANAYQL